MVRLLFLVISLALAPSAIAQISFGLDVGITTPVGELGTFRSAGPSVTASAGMLKTGWSPRIEFTASRLLADKRPADESFNSIQGTYTSAGAQLSLLYRAGGRVRPYGMVGGGLYHISIDRDQSPYGSLFAGLQVGVGLDIAAGPIALAVEAEAVVMATDYGAGAFNLPTVHVPVTVGVRF